MSHWFSPTRLMLSAVVIALCVLLAVGTRSLRMRQSQSGNIGALVMMLISIWLPATVRDVVVSLCLVVIFGLAAGLIGAGITAAVCVGFAMAVPGGTTAATTALTVLCVIAVAIDAFQMSRRIRAAQRLVPGEDSPHDVLITGVVRGPIVNTVVPSSVSSGPTDRPPIAMTAWRVTRDNAHFMSPMFTIETPEGRVRCSFKDARYEMQGRAAISTTEPDQADALAKALGLNFPDNKHAVSVAWIEPNEVISVVGRPRWEPSVDGGESYRESPMLPHFEGTKESPILVTNLSAQEARRNAIWDGLTYFAWSAVCAAVAWFQIGKVI